MSETLDPGAVTLLAAYVRDIVDHRRRHPGDDLVTALIDRLDARELHDENALLSDPDGWAACVKEVLRYDSPTQATARYVSADLEVGGVKIKRGQDVLASITAANCDPDQFIALAAFNIARAAVAIACAEPIVIIAARRERPSAAVIGIMLSTVGVGGVAGSFIASRLRARFGFVRPSPAWCSTSGSSSPCSPSCAVAFTRLANDPVDADEHLSVAGD